MHYSLLLNAFKHRTAHTTKNKHKKTTIILKSIHSYMTPHERRKSCCLYAMCPVMLGWGWGVADLGFPLCGERKVNKSMRDKRYSTSFPMFHRISYHLHKYPPEPRLRKIVKQHRKLFICGRKGEGKLMLYNINMIFIF